MIDFIIRILEKIVAALHFLSGRSGLIEKLFSFFGFGEERISLNANIYEILIFLAAVTLSGLLMFIAFASVKRKNPFVNYKGKVS